MRCKRSSSASAAVRGWGQTTRWRHVTLAAAVAMAVSCLLPAGASANASGVPCGTEITHDTTLHHNIVGCTGDGLVIAADNVTLNLAGRRISGTGTGAGVSVQGGRAVVKNGTITGFASGVDLDHSGPGELSRLKIRRNGAAVSANFASVAITDSTIADNAQGVSVFSGRLTMMRSRVVRNGGPWAIYNREGGGTSLYQGNVIAHNAGDGLYVRDVVSRLIGNRASHNGGNGIYVTDGSATPFPYWFADNVANHNGKLGVAFVLDSVPDLSYADGGGNVARGNGDPSQCAGITCSRKRQRRARGHWPGRTRQLLLTQRKRYPVRWARSSVNRKRPR